MPYTPTTWSDGQTKLGPTNLDKLENGTRDAYTQAHDLFNVKDVAYGAKGDGTTDDSSAINAAFAAAVAAANAGATGVEVRIPKGKYLCKSTVGITMSSNCSNRISITGNGVLVADTSLGSNSLLALRVSGTAQWSNFVVRDITLTSAGSGHTGDLFLVNAPSGAIFNYLIDNVSCLGFTGNGFHIEGINFQWEMHSCYSFSARQGVNPDSAGIAYWIDGNVGSGTSQWSMMNCSSQGGSYGIKSTTVSQDIKIIGGTYLRAQNQGILVNMHGGAIVGVHCEQNGEGSPGVVAGMDVTGWGTIVGYSCALSDTNQLYGVRVYNDISAAGGRPMTVLGPHFSPSAAGSPAYLRADGAATGSTVVTDVPLQHLSVAGSQVTLVRLQDNTDPLKALSVIGSTIPRDMATTSGLTAPTSGTLYLFGIYLPSGAKISNISFVSGATPLATGSNQWFALYDKNLAKLQVTADDTSTAWGASTLKTLALASPYTTTYDGLYYLGLMVNATTPPTLTGQGSLQAVTGLTPRLAIVTSNTGLTNPASAPATATISGNVSIRPFAEVT